MRKPASCRNKTSQCMASSSSIRSPTAFRSHCKPISSQLVQAFACGISKCRHIQENRSTSLEMLDDADRAHRDTRALRNSGFALEGCRRHFQVFIGTHHYEGPASAKSQKSLTMRPNHAATTAQCLLCCVLFCSHRLSLFWKSNAPSLFGYAFTAAKGIVSCVLVSLQLGEGLMLGPERAASQAHWQSVNIRTTAEL